MNSFKLALVCFGLIVLATAQSNRSPGQLLVDHINALVLSVRTEQTEHDDIHVIQSRECNDETGFRKKEVTDANDALVRATEHKGRCTAAYASANADQIRTKTYATVLNEQLEQIVKRRSDEADSFKNKVQHLNAAATTLDSAEQVVSDLSAGRTSFLQVTKHFNTAFLQVNQAGFVGELAPLLAVLVQAGENEGQLTSDDVARVRQLIASLREKLEDSVTLLSQNENSAIQEFQDRKNRVNGLLEQLQNTQNRLAAYIAQMQACITKEDDIINSATSKRIRNQNLLNYAGDMCSAFETEYSDATAARRREIDLLGKLRTFVEQKSDEFSSYGGENQDIFGLYAQTSQQAKNEVEFLQLRANLRARKN